MTKPAAKVRFLHFYWNVHLILMSSEYFCSSSCKSNSQNSHVVQMEIHNYIKRNTNVLSTQVKWDIIFQVKLLTRIYLVIFYFLSHELWWNCNHNQEQNQDVTYNILPVYKLDRRLGHPLVFKTPGEIKVCTNSSWKSPKSPCCGRLMAEGYALCNL